MGPAVYFIHFAALPCVYLRPCMYMSPALIWINTVAWQGDSVIKVGVVYVSIHILRYLKEELA